MHLAHFVVAFLSESSSVYKYHQVGFFNQPSFLSENLHLHLLKMYTSKGGLLILKLLRKMLTRILILSGRPGFSATDNVYDGSSSVAEDLPDDVKEGHFVVHTMDHGELRRFVVELGYLSDPGFLKLLDQAAEEFGFRREGVLVLPCHPNELQRILEKRTEKKI